MPEYKGRVFLSCCAKYNSVCTLGLGIFVEIFETPGRTSGFSRGKFKYFWIVLERFVVFHNFPVLSEFIFINFLQILMNIVRKQRFRILEFYFCIGISVLTKFWNF